MLSNASRGKKIWSANETSASSERHISRRTGDHSRDLGDETVAVETDVKEDERCGFERAHGSLRWVGRFCEV